MWRVFLVFTLFVCSLMLLLRVLSESLSEPAWLRVRITSGVLTVGFVPCFGLCVHVPMKSFVAKLLLPLISLKP